MSFHRTIRTIIRLSAVLAVVALAKGCGDGDSPSAPPTPEPARPTTVTVSPATHGLTALGATVQLSAEVRDQNARVMAGATVTWTSSASSMATVNASGLVTAAGNGTATITASAGSASGSAVVTVDQVEAAVSIVSGGSQSGRAGSMLPDPIIAEVTDAGGAPIEGVGVGFTPETGHGTADPASATTDSLGQARAAWTVGDSVGTQKLVVTAGEVSAVVSATVLQPLPAATINAASQSVSEGGTLDLAIRLDEPADSTVAISYGIGKDDDEETADATPADFQDGGQGTVVIPAGSTQQGFSITVLDDDEAEPAWELFTVALAPPDSGALYSVREPATRVVTLEEGVCDRTPRIRDLLRSGSPCTAVSPSDLLGIRQIRLRGSGSELFQPDSSPTDGPGRGSSVALDRGLERVPDGDTPGLQTFRGRVADATTDIAELRPGDFHGLRNLNFIELRQIALTTLPSGIFDGLHNLEILDLVGNDLRGLPPGVFDDLSRLRRLILGNNSLRSLPDEVFANNHALEVLWLSRNRLTSLPSSIRNLHGLEFLNVGDNELTRLPEGMFDRMSDLEILHLYANNIASLAPGVFDGLRSVEWLQVWGNELTRLPDGVFDRLPNLRRLSISSNRITELQPGIFANLSATSLEQLYLGGNELAQLPSGLFDRLPALRTLALDNNQLLAFPRDMFAALSGLEQLFVDGNPGSPFPVSLEVVRTDSDGASSPAPADLSVSTGLVLPFPLTIELSVDGGSLSQRSLEILAGDTIAEATVVATRDSGDGAWSVSVSEASGLPVEGLPGGCEFSTEDPCTAGLEVRRGTLVLQNPSVVKLAIPSVYVTQASQDTDGTVPLVAGRDGLLRVFAVADQVNSFRPAAASARLLRDGREIETLPLERAGGGGVPLGDPNAVDQSPGMSYEAVIPGELLREGTAVVVEFDENSAPFAQGSILRFPTAGALPLNVRRLPELDLTLVPIHFASQTNAHRNRAVDDWIRDESEEDLKFPLAVLPIGDMRVRVREPYVTWADTMASGGYGLLNELDLVRHVERGDAIAYWHGIFAYPRGITNPEKWFAGVGQRPGFTALSEYSGPPVAHELGHNFSLGHAPCGTTEALDPEYPYPDGSIGVWGWGWNGNSYTGRRLLKPSTKDVMTYCRGAGISDYNFRKAFEHRLELQQASGRVGFARTGSTLLLWGGMDGGRLRLRPAFVWEAAVKLPERPGRYRLDGLSDNGTELFSLSFDPDPVEHGGAGFLFAIPFDPSWTGALDRITLSGPEGTVMVDRSVGERAAIVTGVSGRIRSIVPDLPLGGAEAALASGGVRIVRGLPTRRPR